MTELSGPGVYEIRSATEDQGMHGVVFSLPKKKKREKKRKKENFDSLVD